MCGCALHVVLKEENFASVPRALTNGERHSLQPLLDQGYFS
jgi:hypothetical protein